MQAGRQGSTKPKRSPSQQTLYLTEDNLLEVTKFQDHLGWDRRKKGHLHPFQPQ